jgi:hypothetical protein
MTSIACNDDDASATLQTINSVALSFKISKSNGGGLIPQKDKISVVLDEDGNLLASN